MVLAAKLVHQGYPEFAVMFKFFQFGGIDDVAQIAGNHDVDLEV